MLEAFPEELFPCIAAWLENQVKGVEYEDLKSYVLQTLTLPISAHAQCLLSMPLLPLVDFTAHTLWNENPSSHCIA